MITETKDKESYCINGFEFEINLSSYFKSENVLLQRFSFSMKYAARIWRDKEYLMGNQECMEKEQKNVQCFVIHAASS